MAGTNYHAHPYIRSLNSWHLELSILQTAFSNQVAQVEDEEQGAIFHVLQEHLIHLVESLPFPSEGMINLDAEVQS